MIKKVNVVDSIEHYCNLIRDLQRLQDLEESQLVEYHNEMSKIFSARVFNQMFASKQTLQISKLDTNPKLVSEDYQSINDLEMKKTGRNNICKACWKICAPIP